MAKKEYIKMIVALMGYKIVDLSFKAGVWNLEAIYDDGNVHLYTDDMPYLKIEAEGFVNMTRRLLSFANSWEFPNGGMEQPFMLTEYEGKLA